MKRLEDRLDEALRREPGLAGSAPQPGSPADSELDALAATARRVTRLAPPAPDADFVERLGLLLQQAPPPARSEAPRRRAW
ncbi:MAG TPA: hypothetical protein VGE07_10500, partial [Herpetosiphonaceae bacterium]